jgi:isoleucyl-tRNA synthetase
VHYSPSSRSALAEAELTYADAHVSHSVYVAFAVDGAAAGVPDALRDALNGASDVRLLVWTTTPWTLSANMAIAANPELAYAVLRQTDTGRVVLVAKELLSELGDVLGPTELLADVPGES